MIPTLTTEDNPLSTKNVTELDLEPQTMMNYQDPKTSNPLILAPWSIHLPSRGYQRTGIREATGTSESERSQNIMKAFPKAPSASSVSYLLLALSDAGSAGFPHSTNASFLCFFSAGGGQFSAPAHKTQTVLFGLHVPFKL